MKSEKEIKAMIAAIEKDIKEVPETNAFGDSNYEEIKELIEIVALLKMAEAGISIDKDTEAGAWLAGKFSLLDAYLED